MIDKKVCLKIGISSDGKYRGKKLQGKENHRIWKIILELSLKSKRLWKYVKRKAIYLIDSPSFQSFSSTNNPLSPQAESQPNNNKDLKAQLVIQEDYEAESEWTKKSILTSVENILRLTIVEKATSQKMLEALKELFEASNKSCL